MIIATSKQYLLDIEDVNRSIKKLLDFSKINATLTVSIEEYLDCQLKGGDTIIKVQRIDDDWCNVTFVYGDKNVPVMSRRLIKLDIPFEVSSYVLQRHFGKAVRFVGVFNETLQDNVDTEHTRASENPLHTNARNWGEPRKAIPLHIPTVQS